MYIPDEWILNKDNTDRIFELLESISDVKADKEDIIAKSLEKMRETILLEKYNSGELVM